MNRIVFALALVCVASSSAHASAQERVAHIGAIKPARIVAANHAAKPKSAASSSAPVRTSSGDGSTLAAPTDAGFVSSHPGQDLADVQAHGTTTSGSGAEERAITVAAVTESKVSRTLATPRLLRRMNADRTVPKLAADFRACYTEDPAQKTAATAVVRVEIEADGSIDQATFESGAVTTPQIRACILSVGTAATFSAPGGTGTAVLVQVSTR
jgi:hypothetical protein